MNGPLNQIPVGLLGLLGIKNNGELPKELAEFIQPTLDMMPFLAGNAWTAFQDQRSFPTGNFGDFSYVTAVPSQSTPPPGKAWLVAGAYIYAAPIATDLIIYAVGHGQLTGGQRYIKRLSDWTGANAGLQAPGGARAGFVRTGLPGPFLMLPGEEIFIACQDVISATSVITYLRGAYLEFNT